MTKKQARERKAAWSLALAEGRVLRHLAAPLALTAYQTIAARDAAMQRDPMLLVVNQSGAE